MILFRSSTIKKELGDFDRLQFGLNISVRGRCAIVSATVWALKGEWDYEAKRRHVDTGRRRLYDAVF
jgi:hypothetical protein